MENTVTLIPNRHERVPFIEGEFLPAGMNEYYLRDTQVQEPESGWRHLRFDEIERLVKNQNTSDNWDNILVTDHFEPKLVKNNKFYGLVRIGDMCDGWLQYHDLKLKVGITNSLIDSCDIGNYVAIHDVHYLTHYIIGDKCILFNIQEMCCTNHSKFGNGIVKDGEPEKVRIAVEVMNETASRKVYPFDGMIAADAYLEARYIDDKELQAKLLQFTQERYDSRRGYYGTVGTETVIKNSAIIKDVKIGSSCYIKGASKLNHQFFFGRAYSDWRRRGFGEWYRGLRLPYFLFVHCGTFRHGKQFEPEIRRSPYQHRFGRQLHHFLLRSFAQPYFPGSRTTSQQLFPGGRRAERSNQYCRRCHVGLQPQQPHQRQRNSGRSRILAGTLFERETFLPICQLHPAKQGRLSRGNGYQTTFLFGQ